MLAWFNNLFGAKAAKSDKLIALTLIVAGAVGLVASLALSIERIQQLVDPNAQLICNFNAIFNCGTVMKTWQAKVFGFPNSFIGLMAYPVVITLGAVLLNGVKLPRRFMMTAQICFALGLLFAYWLFFQSVFVIQVLCPWCLLVTVATTILFDALLRYNVRHQNLYLDKQLNKWAQAWLDKDYDKLLVAAWLVLMFVIVLIKFPGIF